MKTKISSRTYWSEDNYEEHEYTEAQKRRWVVKRASHSRPEYYRLLVQQALMLPIETKDRAQSDLQGLSADLAPSTKWWLCLGVRNPWEKLSIKSVLNPGDVTFFDVDILDDIDAPWKVYDNDIHPDSDADVIGDYCHLDIPQQDVVFTNAIDHAADPSAAYLSMLSYVRPGGLLIVDFGIVDLVNKSDCSAFSLETIDAFLEEAQDKGLLRIEVIIELETCGNWIVWAPKRNYLLDYYKKFQSFSQCPFRAKVGGGHKDVWRAFVRKL